MSGPVALVIAIYGVAVAMMPSVPPSLRILGGVAAVYGFVHALKWAKRP